MVGLSFSVVDSKKTQKKKHSAHAFTPATVRPYQTQKALKDHTTATL